MEYNFSVEPAEEQGPEPNRAALSLYEQDVAIRPCTDFVNPARIAVRPDGPRQTVPAPVDGLLGEQAVPQTVGGGPAAPTGSEYVVPGTQSHLQVSEGQHVRTILGRTRLDPWSLYAHVIWDRERRKSFELYAVFRCAPYYLGRDFSSTWGLNDGLLAVSTVANGTKWNGKGSDSTSSSLYGDITGQLPTAIEEVALALQSVAIAPQATCTPTTITPSNGLPTTFTVATTGAQFTYTPVAISDSGVGDVLLGLDIALKNASTDGTFATLGLTNAANVSGASALDILQGTLAEPDPANANVYHNWICVQTQGGCATNGSGATWVPYYIARARRLNSYPDSVELVWTDDLEIEVGPLTNYCCANRCGQTPTSCATTSALPLYVLLEDQFLQSGSAPGGSAGQSLAKLCTASALAQATRQFYTFHSGHMYHSYQNVVNCAANQIGDFFSNQPGWATALTIGLCAAFTTNPTCGLL